MTSPRAVAVPEGTLSVHMRYPVTAVRQHSVSSEHIAARIAAAPDMSFFIWAWIASDGFRLMPPESYMIPLPTIASDRAGSAGRYESLIIRASCTLPALTH